MVLVALSAIAKVRVLIRKLLSMCRRRIIPLKYWYLDGSRSPTWSLWSSPLCDYHIDYGQRRSCRDLNLITVGDWLRIACNKTVFISKSQYYRLRIRVMRQKRVSFAITAITAVWEWTGKWETNRCRVHGCVAISNNETLHSLIVQTDRDLQQISKHLRYTLYLSSKPVDLNFRISLTSDY